MGIRSGELMALTPAKVRGQILIVDKNYDAYHRVLTDVKTSTVRQSLMPYFLVEEINTYIKDNNIPEHEFIFKYNSARILRKILKRTIEDNNLHKINLHELRHSCVSMLIDRNVDIVFISNFIGHSNPLTTITYYSHIYKLKNKKISLLLEDIHNNKK